MSLKTTKTLQYKLLSYDMTQKQFIEIIIICFLNIRHYSIQYELVESEPNNILTIHFNERVQGFNSNDIENKSNTQTLLVYLRHKYLG